MRMAALQGLMERMRRIDKLSVFALALSLMSLRRLIVAVRDGWQNYGGENLDNFPLYSLLQKFNTELYDSLPHDAINWHGPKQGWFYGPVHHLVHFPLTLVSPSVDFFYKALMVFYLVAFTVVPFYLVKTMGGKKVFLYGVLVFAVTFGHFAFLDGLRQRNIELMQFVFIVAAFLLLRKGHDGSSGAMMCLAALCKMLPFIFLPYLIIKKRYRALAGFVLTLLCVLVLTHFTLGFDNWVMLAPGITRRHGLPALGDILQGKLMESLHNSPSFYTFLRVFFVNGLQQSGCTGSFTYDASSVVYLNIIFVVIAAALALPAFYMIYRSKDNHFFDFAVLTTLMHVIYPHNEPTYYINVLFGFYFLLFVLLNDSRDSRDDSRLGYFLPFALITVSLFFGQLIPVSLVERVSGLNCAYNFYYEHYGIPGAGAVIMLCAVLFTGPRRGKNAAGGADAGIKKPIFQENLSPLPPV